MKKKNKTKYKKEDNKEDFTEEVQEQPKEEPKETPAPTPQEDLPKGVLLRRVREQQGLSLEAVHEATKIPMDALRAIEEDYTIRTLSPFYIKGFLKIYAQYLGVDVSEVIEDYKKEELPKPIKKDESEEIEIQQILSSFLTRERKRQLVYIFGILLSFFIIFKIITFFTTRKPRPPSKEKDMSQEQASSQKPAAEDTKPESAVSAVVPEVKPKDEPPRSVPASGTSSSQTVKKDVTLTVRAKKRSWLRVRADDRTVFQSTLHSGSVETWRADHKIEITGRNIDQLEFELNGKLIGTLGRKDRRAIGVIVTKDGLSVMK